MATIALLHQGGGCRDGYQGLERRLEDSSSESRDAHRYGGIGRERKYTYRRDNHAQESKDRSDSCTIEERICVQERHPSTTGT
jgi:hypothetical protein